MLAVCHRGVADLYGWGGKPPGSRLSSVCVRLRRVGWGRPVDPFGSVYVMVCTSYVCMLN